MIYISYDLKLVEVSFRKKEDGIDKRQSEIINKVKNSLQDHLTQRKTMSEKLKKSNKKLNFRE